MASNSHLIWKTIPDYRFYYEASNTGVIRSKDRFVDGYSAKAGRPIKIKRKSTVLSQNTRGSGYKYVCICVDGMMKKEQVHKLVLMAFCGVRPEGMVACHNDGNPANNTIENLRWDTIKSNQQDIDKHNTRAKGENVGTATLKDSDVIEIRKSKTFKDVKSKINVSKTNYYRIKNRLSWVHVLS